MAKKVKDLEESVDGESTETSEVEQKEKKTSIKKEFKDDLTLLIAKNINKEFKNQPDLVQFMDGDETNASDVRDWVSTGSSLLDLIISNRPNGGVPSGRIVELLGLEGCVTVDTLIEVEIDE